MLSRLACAAGALFGLVAANTMNPGVPVNLGTLPLNRTLFPLGYSANLTRALTYETVPIDQYAFFIPLNAYWYQVTLNVPGDDNNDYLDYTYSTTNQLCQYRYQLDYDGYTCGGYADEDSYVYVDDEATQYFFNFSSYGVDDRDNEGYRWRTNTWMYFGLTADNSADDTYNYPVSYQIADISVALCPAGQIGGETYESDEPACLNWAQLASSNTTFNYTNVLGSDGYTIGSVYETTVPAGVGRMTVQISFPVGEDDDILTYMMGNSNGGVGRWADCQESTDDDSDAGTHYVTWGCDIPTPGPFFIWFRPDEAINITNGKIAITYQTCANGMAGPSCQYESANLGSIPAANMFSTSTFTVLADNTTEFMLNVPVNTTYGFNVTFNSALDCYIYARPNAYASQDDDSGFPNDYYYVSTDSTTVGYVGTFVFQFQQNYQGATTYFAVYNDNDANNQVNVTISTGAVVTPTTGGTTATGTGTATTRTGTATGTTSTRTGTTATGTTSTRSGTSTNTGTSGENSSASFMMACAIVSVFVSLLF